MEAKAQEQQFTDKQIFAGYAFKSYEKELREYIRNRYEQIKDTPGISIKKEPKYGRTCFSGELTTDEARELNATDLAIIADHGNLCFGGECTKSGDRFSGCYHID